MLASDTLCLSCCFFIVSRANLLEGPMWYTGVSFHKLTSLLFMMVSLFSLGFNVPLITFGLSIWAECVATFLQCVWNFLEIYFTLHDVGPFPKLYALGLHKKLALIIIDKGACQSVPTNVEFDFLLYPKRCRMDRHHLPNFQITSDLESIYVPVPPWCICQNEHTCLPTF